MKKYFLLLFIGFSLSALGQTDPNLPNSEIEIIKSFNARLGEAEILSVQLPAHQIDTSRAFIRQYQLSDQPVKLQYPAPQVKPLAMERGENPINYPFFLKLGYGLQNNPLGLLAYHVAGDRVNLDAHISYESLKDLNNDEMKFQDIEGHIKADIGLTDLIQLNSGFNYLRQNRTLYGSRLHPFERETEFIYDIPQFNLGFQNAIETAANIDYILGYTFRSTTDNLGNQESNHAITGNVVKAFGDSGFRFGINAVAELNKLKNTTTAELNNYIAGVYLGFIQNEWNVRGGVDVALLDSETKILPQVLLNAFISPAVRPYLGVQSQVIQNNFYSLTRANPYIIRNLENLKNQTVMDIFGGVQGSFERANYEVRIGYEISDQKAFFINNFSDTSTFKIAHDDINTLSIALKGDVNVMDGLTSGASLKFNNYSVDSLDEAWHLPTFEWSLFSSYDKLMAGKLAITAKFNSQSGINYLDANNESQKLGTYINFSILLDYDISPKISAFLHLNNLFNSQKERYFGYDRVGINPQIGLTAKF